MYFTTIKDYFNCCNQKQVKKTIQSFIKSETMKGIIDLQRNYFRRAIGAPRFSCADAILFDLAVTRLDIRIKGERDKFCLKAECFCPRIISSLRDKRLEVSYIYEIEHSSYYKYGFAEISKNNNKRKKWCTKVTIKRDDKTFLKNITGYSPREVYGLKIKYIKMNYIAWRNQIMSKLYNEFEINKDDPILEREIFEHHTSGSVLNQRSSHYISVNLKMFFWVRILVRY